MTVRSRELDTWAWLLGVSNDEDGHRVAGRLLSELTEHMEGISKIGDRISSGPGDVPGLISRSAGLLEEAGDGLVDVEAFARHERGHQ